MASIRDADLALVFSRASLSLERSQSGGVGALIAVMGSVYGPKVVIGACVAIPLAVLVVLRPRLGVLLFIFALCFLEEFPGGLSDQDVQRSARLPFYATTFGLPAIYPPDAIIGGLLGLFLLRKLIWSEGYGIRLDKIGAALLMLAATMAISIVIGLMGDRPRSRSTRPEPARGRPRCPRRPRATSRCCRSSSSS